MRAGEIWSLLLLKRTFQMHSRTPGDRAWWPQWQRPMGTQNGPASKSLADVVHGLPLTEGGSQEEAGRGRTLPHASLSKPGAGAAPVEAGARKARDWAHLLTPEGAKTKPGPRTALPKAEPQ